MKASIKGNTLTIEIEMNEKPQPSATGKTLVIASSKGNKPMPLEVDGKTVIIGLNAYISAK